jgi:hypothetical protein
VRAAIDGQARAELTRAGRVGVRRKTRRKLKPARKRFQVWGKVGSLDGLRGREERREEKRVDYEKKCGCKTIQGTDRTVSVVDWGTRGREREEREGAEVDGWEEGER